MFEHQLIQNLQRPTKQIESQISTKLASQLKMSTFPASFFGGSCPEHHCCDRGAQDDAAG